MSISHYATDALTITGQRDMKSNETTQNDTKTNAIYAGEQDGCIRYGASKRKENGNMIKVEIERTNMTEIINAAHIRIERNETTAYYGLKGEPERVYVQSVSGEEIYCNVNDANFKEIAVDGEVIMRSEWYSEALQSIKRR